MENFDPLVTNGWLAGHLEDPAVRIVDIRGYVKKTDLGGGRQKAEYLGARDEYDEAHVPGAVYVDWTRDITDPDDAVLRAGRTAGALRASYGLSGHRRTRRTSSSTTTPAASSRRASGGR